MADQPRASSSPTTAAAAAAAAANIVSAERAGTLGGRGRLHTLDVAGAYMHGRSLQPQEGGCVTFVPVKPGFEQFGFPERDPVTGERNYFAVSRNLPGRS
mmetsp:Transcript_8532/g.17338  ORF Transcript_8532/g.17338 Transcript_8532/m.17338 type:complete len:100 (+) Transcript_8532:1286-1585(+)